MTAISVDAKLTYADQKEVARLAIAVGPDSEERCSTGKAVDAALQKAIAMCKGRG